MDYHFYGGPFAGLRTSRLMLGEWVVLFCDENQQPSSAENTYALAAYREESNDGEISYRFNYCLTPTLQRFHVEYADGPFVGAEISDLPIMWLPAEVARPLDGQARAIRGRSSADGGATYLAHYERRSCGQGHKYYFTKITRPTSAESARWAA